MENGTATNKKVIVFQLQDEEYAVQVEDVGGIERLESITRVPQAANFVKGVMNLRGVVTPVIDLRIRFGMEAIDDTESTRIIIVYFEGMEVGLIVDTANDVIDIPSHLIEPAPQVIGAVDADYVEGVVKLDNRLLILLNLQKVLTNNEDTKLEKVEG